MISEEYESLLRQERVLDIFLYALVLRDTVAEIQEVMTYKTR
jgi:hypothetical protein